MNLWASAQGLAGALAAGALALGLMVGLTGCGTPGAPQAPSLKLPDRVADLEAARNGGEVTLRWKMPRRTTDKVNLRGPIEARICRQLAGGACEPVASEPQFEPGAEASFAETLPGALATGEPRPLAYFVELRNARGRSAGLSNPAMILAGQAPAPVTGLRAEPHKDGIALAWTALSPEPAGSVVRLQRHLLKSATATPAEAKKDEGLLAPPSEAVDRSLVVEEPNHPGRALDRSVRLGESYEYRAQRVARIAVEGRTVELAGALSEPVRVEAQDIFPPAAPGGLAAVATAGENGGATIDLSWQPNTETELAGYAVYRAEEGGVWRRVSPEKPVAAPAFRDAHVEAGRSYRYAVTAIGRNGRESARSAETSEYVPQTN